jgi:hypothetical protein
VGFRLFQTAVELAFVGVVAWAGRESVTAGGG